LFSFDWSFLCKKDYRKNFKRLIKINKSILPSADSSATQAEISLLRYFLAAPEFIVLHPLSPIGPLIMIYRLFSCT